MTHPSPALVLAALLGICAAPVSAAQPPKAAHTQKVLGIGGLFFRSEHPEQLATWYETHLGVSPVPTKKGESPWHQQAGPTAFAPFKKDTKYFGKLDHGWMVNFRVADLKAMVAQLRGEGILVDEPKSYPNGLFAWLRDPEGNPIELWQPLEPGR